MTLKQLALRIEKLERDVASLLAAQQPRKDWWKDWVGIATHDPIMQEAFALAKEYREKDRRKARREGKKTRAKKKLR